MIRSVLSGPSRVVGTLLRARSYTTSPEPDFYPDTWSDTWPNEPLPGPHDARLFDPHTPFFNPTLDALRARLRALSPGKPSISKPYGVLCQRQPSEAAVLIPLINMEWEGARRPGVLMQLRSSTMRNHPGEMSFPGGKLDSNDGSLLETALRETEEELGISPKQVQILGALPPAWSLGNRARVWPFVGFVHSKPTGFRLLHTTTLFSPKLGDLKPNPAEVAAVLPVPLPVICDPTRHTTHYFRMDGAKPYPKIRIDDLIPPVRLKQAAKGPQGQPTEIWGLSGWFLSQLAWRAGWLVPPDPHIPDN